MSTETEDMVTEQARKACRSESTEGLENLFKDFKIKDMPIGLRASDYEKVTTLVKKALQSGYDAGLISGVVVGTLEERYGLNKEAS